MVPTMQFARDQILNPSHKKESCQGKEMNHPLSHCFESSGLYDSAVCITAPTQAKCWDSDCTSTHNNPWPWKNILDLLVSDELLSW